MSIRTVENNEMNQAVSGEINPELINDFLALKMDLFMSLTTIPGTTTKASDSSITSPTSLLETPAE